MWNETGMNDEDEDERHLVSYQQKKPVNNIFIIEEYGTLQVMSLDHIL